MSIKTPTQILQAEERRLNWLLMGGTLTVGGLSAYYWVGLPTQHYTVFTTPALLGALLSLLMVIVYEATKQNMAKAGESSRVLIMMMAFSIITGVGTHMGNEQAMVENKMNKSSVMNTDLKNIEDANAQVREFGYAANFDVAQLEAKKAALLKTKAVDAKGKETDYTVGTVVAKGWKSYAHYKDQVTAIENDIRAKQKYDSAKQATVDSKTSVGASGATESAEANWLLQLVGSVLVLFVPSLTKVNVWSAFLLYLVSSWILEASIIRNGKRHALVTQALCGFDPTDIRQVTLAIAAERQQQLPAPVQQAAPALQHTPPAEPVQTHVDTVEPTHVDMVAPAHDAHVKTYDDHMEMPEISVKDLTVLILNRTRKGVNTGAILLTHSGINAAVRTHLEDISKTHRHHDIRQDDLVEWIYSRLRLEQQKMIEAKQSKQPVSLSKQEDNLLMTALAQPLDEASTPRRPIGFVHTDIIGKAETLIETLEKHRIDTPFNAVQPPSSGLVLPSTTTLVEPCRQPPCNLVDNPQQGHINKGDVQPQQGEQKPNIDETADHKNRALDIIWQGIDKGIIDKVSVSDNGKCQAALKGHNIGKSNPQRRELLAWVFDALEKEGVIRANPDYTDPKCGRDKWLINQSRTIKYAA